jgi:hypothetical protein
VLKLQVSAPQVVAFEYSSSTLSQAAASTPLDKVGTGTSIDQITPKSIRLAASNTLSQKIKGVMLLGVEGVGHHGTKLLLNAMAEVAGWEVVRAGEDEVVRPLVMRRDRPGLIKELRRRFAKLKPRQVGLVVLFKGSFPGRQNIRGSCIWEAIDCMSKIPEYPFYDVDWIFETLNDPQLEVGQELQKNKSMPSNTAVIWLNRDFANVVASHQEWDGGLERHGEVIAVYLQFIQTFLANRIPRHVWARLDYDTIGSIGPQTTLRSLGQFFGRLLRNNSAGTQRTVTTEMFADIASPAFASSRRPLNTLIACSF